MMLASNETKKRLLQELEETADQTGLTQFIDYGVLTGSFVLKGKQERDIDLLIVLRPKTDKNAGLIQKMRRFSIRHAVIQLEYGFNPDWDFPTYFATRQQIDETLQGRPFRIDQSNRLVLTQYSPQAWITNQESDYNVLLFQLVSHNFDLFAGLPDSLKEDTRKALLAIFLHVYQYFGYDRWDTIDKQRLAQDLFRCIGKDYVLSSRLQEIFLQDVLIGHGLGSIHKDSIFVLHHPAIQQKLKEFLGAFSQQYTADHAIRWQDMRKDVSSLIRGEKVIDRVYNYLFHGKDGQQEWESWEMRTKAQLELLRQGNQKPVEVSDPGEIRYYKMLHDSIIQILPREGFSVERMLEVGSGSGALSSRLSDTFGCESSLIDISPVALEYASFISPNSQMILGDAMKMPFLSEEFDFLHSVGLIEHFDDKTVFRMLFEMKRVLKEEGYLYLAVPNFLCLDLLSIWWQHGKGAEKYISLPILTRYAEQVGLAVISKGRFPYVHEIFPRYHLECIESVLGKQAFGFLNYVLCRKKRHRHS